MGYGNNNIWYNKKKISEKNYQLIIIKEKIMTKKITTFAIFTALMVVGGYIFYFIASSIPIPGSKFIFMGPYLTCVMILPLIRYPKFGTLSLINLAFGGVMFILSPWMTVAIVVSGVAADFIMLIPIEMKARQVLSMGIYNGMSLLTSFFISNYITGNLLYNALSYQGVLIAFIISAAAGMLGGYGGIRIARTYLRLQKY